MKISFCTTCMGRRQHLEQTLLKNIEDNLPKKDGDPSVEFVLVEYGRKDNLKEMIENNGELKRYLDNGTLVYAKYPDADHFHHAHAKNMAHRLAKGDVLCNLDADNYTGKNFARYLAKEFADGKHTIVHPGFSAFKDLPAESYGCYGRIALRQEDFLTIGGYSETRFKKGWGDEDKDLIIRALAYGLNPQPMFERSFFGVIPHTDEERVQNTAGGITAKDVGKLCTGLRVHINTFKMYASPMQANPGGHFGEGTVLIDGKEQVIGPVKPFARISGRTIRGRRALRRDYAAQPPAKDKTVSQRPVKAATQVLNQ